MDDADRAQKETDLNLKLSLQNHKREPEVFETGSCNWCDSLIEQGAFCDADCRDDFEKSKVMKG